MRKTIWAALAATTIGVLALSGCSAPAASDDGRVQIVASTNVYGDVAATVGGDRVAVRSLIDSVAKDPHSYEATARDMLEVSRADLLIENGGGYDAFMDDLRADSDAPVVTAFDFSGQAEGDDSHAEAHDGHGHSHLEGVNEHVWFDVHTMIHVVEQIEKDLARIDKAGAAEYAKNADALIADLEGVEKEIDALHTKLEGTPVLITEPLPGLLAASAGLDDVTPDGFAAAVEEGNDVPPATLLAAVRLIEDGKADAVLSTVQTEGAETVRLEKAAKDAGIPVIRFSELLEPDQSYPEWMRAAVQSLSEALAA
ncbi:MAG: zinc ABC transporter substrate-binding protein [Microbacterium sp.]|jgi:zinc/manganese transport system substrate-binding protein|nr:zinc ABC transporter substrate-binding protein [Microbacterium sp.]